VLILLKIKCAARECFFHLFKCVGDEIGQCENGNDLVCTTDDGYEKIIEDLFPQLGFVAGKCGFGNGNVYRANSQDFG
jgi:hypothetical protein